MKIKQGFVLSKISGITVAVATGAPVAGDPYAITLSETSEFLWRLMCEDVTEDALVAALTDQYDVDENVARADVSDLISELSALGVLEK